MAGRSWGTRTLQTEVTSQYQGQVWLRRQQQQSGWCRHGWAARGAPTAPSICVRVAAIEKIAAVKSDWA